MDREFSHVASSVARAAGHPLTFGLCCLSILLWAAAGPMFGFSDAWQLIINTGTTILTFLMVFLIQNTQNRDSAAIQAKLDELIRVSKAENAFIGIDLLTQAEVEELRSRCAERAGRVQSSESDTGKPHTRPAAPKSGARRRRPVSQAVNCDDQARS